MINKFMFNEMVFYVNTNLGGPLSRIAEVVFDKNGLSKSD